MSSRRRDYRSYLLRLYRVRRGRESHWRASLQSPQGGKPSHFGSLSALVDFLEKGGDLREDADEQGRAEGCGHRDARLR
jgi:hypothetical protein